MVVADAFSPLADFVGFPSTINKQVSVLLGTLLAACHAGKCLVDG